MYLLLRNGTRASFCLKHMSVSYHNICLHRRIKLNFIFLYEVCLSSRYVQLSLNVTDIQRVVKGDYVNSFITTSMFYPIDIYVAVIFHPPRRIPPQLPSSNLLLIGLHKNVANSHSVSARSKESKICKCVTLVLQCRRLLF
jgi:hypothetical protein